MIHLALSIAAFLFLAYIAVCVGIIVIVWPIAFIAWIVEKLR